MRTSTSIRSRAVAVACGALITAALTAAGAPERAAGEPRLAPQTSGAAADDGSFEVLGVSLGRSSVAVSGLNVVTVPVTVHARYGCDAETGEGRLDATVVLSRVSSGLTQVARLHADLDERDGQPCAQDLTGELSVPSPAQGTYRVSAVIPGAPWYETEPLSPIRYDGPSLTVVSTHPPRLTAHARPAAIRRGVDTTYQVAGRVIDRDTGAPYRQAVPVHLRLDQACVAAVTPPGCVTRTDTNGDFVFVVQNNSAAAPGTQWVDRSHVASLQQVTSDRWDRPQVHLITSVRVPVFTHATVSAVPSSTTTTAGRSFAVNGSAREVPPRRTVAIQQLRGSTQWRTVATGPVRLSGRYTVTVPTSLPGRGVYRAYIAGGRSWTPATSPVFTVTAR